MPDEDGNPLPGEVRWREWARAHGEEEHARREQANRFLQEEEEERRARNLEGRGQAQQHAPWHRMDRNDFLGRLQKEEKMSGEARNVVRRVPKIGVHAIRVSRIRHAPNVATDVKKVEIATHRFADGLPDTPFPVDWDRFDWVTGYVVWKGDIHDLLALRELGYAIVRCQVDIDPASGLKGEVKEVFGGGRREEKLPEQDPPEVGE